MLMREIRKTFRLLSFAVYLKPEMGQTRMIADKLSADQAWRRVDECHRRGMGKAWILPQ